MSADGADALRIRTFGGLSVERGGEPVVDFASRKAEALLVYLACTGREHPREVLAELLWDDRSQSQAMANLRVVLSSLRKEVGGHVEITRTTASIAPGAAVSLDVAQLEAAVDHVREQDGRLSPEVVEEMVAALDAYEGDFLEGFFLPEASGFEAWATAERERLHRLALDALLQLGRWHLEEADYAEAMATSSRLLELDPLAEAGHRQLMEALARQGQRSQALAQYETCREILSKELGVEPAPETEALYQAIRAGEVAKAPRETEATEIGSRQTTLNLPQKLTPFIGRERELADLRGLLGDEQVRLVTITGPGGIGKTHLALEVAREVPESFEDGVAFVSLAPLSETDAIVPTVAQALRFSFQSGDRRKPKAQLLGYLRRKELLLVLDNFEHLLEAAPLLVEIMNTAPRVKLLVTSREQLKLQVERLYPLQGLGLSQWESLADARRDRAVKLFVEYGQRIRPGFALQAEDLGPLRRMFQLVEGMPLAIILAAAWLELLGPAEIAAEIGRSLGFLEADYRDVPPRQRSMRAVFDATWQRLSEEEREVFAALSVFRGGFDLAAARAVTGATPRDLRRLMERSLLARGEEGRFEVHELLRQFAAEQLAQASQREEAVRDAHSAYYLAWLREREPELKGAGSEAALEALATEVENVYAGWDRAVAGRDFADLAPGAFSLATFCMRFGRYEEGLEAFGRANEALREHISRSAAVNPTDLATLVTLLSWQCALQHEVGAVEQAEALGKEALAALERQELQDLDTRRERALALLWLGWVVHAGQNRSVEGKKMLQESVVLFEAAGDAWHKARAFWCLGGVALTQARYDQAVQHKRRSMELFASLGDRRWRAYAEMALGYALGAAEEWDEAEERMRHSMDVFRTIGEQAFAATAGALLAETITYRGKFEEAQAVAAESVEQLEQLGGRRYWLAVSHKNWCRATLHLGAYESVLGRIPLSLNITHEPMNRANILFLAGCARLAQGQTGRARERLEESANGLRQIKSWDYLCQALGGLCCACAIVGELSQAREALLEGMNNALKVAAAHYLAPVLAAAALFMTTVEQAERAVELYALASCEPLVASSRWFEDVAGRRIAEVAESLPAEDVAAARARGEARDLWETAEELLEELVRMEL